MTDNNKLENLHNNCLWSAVSKAHFSLSNLNHRKRRVKEYLT